MKHFRLSNKITNRDSISIELYLQEISRHPLLSNEEEANLAIMIKQGNEVALNKLIKANLRFVVSVAKQFQNSGIPLSDLINEGNIGLIRAAKKFDAAKGFKFISYAVWWVRQAILQSISEQAKLIKIPMQKLIELQKINNAIGKLEQINGNAVVYDIAEDVGLSVEKIDNYYQYIFSTVSTSDYAGGSDGSSSIGDNLMDDTESIEDKLTDKYRYQLLCNSLNNLNERERYIIKNYYGIDENNECTLEEIGEALAITRERVRQIKDRALVKLRSANSYSMAV